MRLMRLRGRKPLLMHIKYVRIQSYLNMEAVHSVEVFVLRETALERRCIQQGKIKRRKELVRL